MSKVIDERVVEMKFDNKQFEAGVKNTMSTLDKLKAALKLDGASKGLQNVDKAAKNVKFDGMVSGIEQVEIKFNALKFTAASILDAIVKDTYRAGKELVKSLSIDNLSAGWEKYEKKTTSAATLVAQGFEQGKVNEVLEKLNWYTDETSYNLTDMIDNISKFTASGKDLDESAKAMQGIANWAALSGQTATKASQAMYQLSQAMGKGALRYDDWKSIQNASMDTKEFREQAVKAAEELGVLKKTGEDTYKVFGKETASLNDLFTSDFLTRKEWFSDDVMMKVFGNYSAAVDQIYDYTQEKGVLTSEAIRQMGDSVDEFGLKAFKAAQEARTWTDVLDSVKDAVSTGWMNTFETIFGDSSEATVFFTDMANNLWDVFAGGAEDRNATLKELMADPWVEFEQRLKSAGISMDMLNDQLHKTASETGLQLDTLIRRAGSLEEVFRQGKISGDFLGHALYGFVDGTNAASESIGNLEDIVKRVIHQEFGNGQKRVEALTKAGYDYKTVQDLVNKTLAGEKIEYDKLSDSQLTNLGLTKDQIASLRSMSAQAKLSNSEFSDLLAKIQRPSGRELLLESITNTVQGLAQVIQVVRDSWNDFIPEDTIERVYSLIERVHSLTESFQLYRIGYDEEGKEIDRLNETGEKLSRTFKGVFAVFSIVGQVLSSTIKGILSVASSLGFIGKSALDTTASIGDMLVSFDSWLKENKIITGSIEGLFSIVTGFIDKIRDGGIAVKEFTDGFGEWEVLKDATKWVEDKWNAAWSKWDEITKGIENPFDKIMAFIHYLERFDISTYVTKVSKAIENSPVQTLINSLKKIKGVFLEVAGSGGGIPEFITKLKELGVTSEKASGKLTDFCKKVGEEIENLLSVFLGKDQKIDWKKVGIFALSSALTIALFKLAKGLRSVGGILNPLRDFGNSLLQTANTFTSALKSLKREAQVNQVLKIATAIGILVGSLWVLTKLAKDPDFDKSVMVLAGIAGALATLVLILGLVTNKIGGAGLANATTGLLMVAGSIGIMVGALFVLSKMPMDDIWERFKVLTAITALVTGVAVILSKFAPKLSSGGVGLLLFAFSLSKFVKVLQSISAMSFEEISRGLYGLIPLCGLLVVLAMAMQNVKGGTGIGALLLVMSISLLYRALKKVAGDDKGWDKIKHGIGRIIVVFLALGVLGKVAKKVGQSSWQGGMSILLITIGIIALAHAMKILADMSDAEILQASKALGAITVCLVALSIACGFANKIGGNAKSDPFKNLVTMIIAMAVAAGALYVLSKLPMENLAVATLALGGVLMAFAYCLRTIGKMPNLKKTTFGALAVMAVFMIGITAALAELAKNPWDRMLGAALSLGIVLLAFGACLQLIQKTDGRTFGTKKIQAMETACLMLGAVTAALFVLSKWGGSAANMIASAIALSLTIGALTLVLLAMDKIKAKNVASSGAMFLEILAILVPVTAALAALLLTGASWDQMIGAAGALSLTIIAMSGALALLGLVPPTSMAGAASLLVASLALIPVAVAISMLAGYKWDELWPAVVTLGLTMLELAGVLAIFALLNPAGAMVGIEALGVAIGGIAGILGILGGLSRIPGLKEVVADGGAFLSSIGEAIGGFIGSIIKGGIEKVVSTLPTIGDNLSQFMIKAMPFIAGMKMVDKDVLEGCLIIAGAMAALTAAELLDGLANFTAFLTGKSSLTKFGQELADFGPYLAKFCHSMDGIKPDQIAACSSALQAVAEFARSIPNEGGLLAKVFGDNGIGQFGEELVSFGENFKKYARHVRGIKPDIVDTSIAAAKSISAFAKELPNQGGILAKWVGDNTMSVFGMELAKFGSYFRVYASHVAGLNSDTVTASAAAAQSLAEFAKSIPNQEGAIAKVFGDNTLSQFGMELAKFGAEFRVYASHVAGINFDTVTASSAAAQSIADFAKHIDNEGGAIAKVFGDNDLGTFAEGLDSFGARFRLYAIYMKGINFDTVTASAAAAQSLVELSNGLERTNGIKQIFTGSKDFKTFGDSLIGLGEGLVGYSNSIAGIKPDELNKVTEVIRDLVEISGIISNVNTNNMELFATNLEILGNSGIQGFVKAFTESDMSIIDAVSHLMQLVIDEITKKEPDTKKAMEDNCDKITKAILDEQTDATTAMRSLMEAIISEIKDVEDDFLEAGKNAALGFINGLSDSEMLGQIAKAAANMGKTAKEAAMKSLNEHSPSKVFEKIGNFTGLGFINGVKKITPKVAKAANDMADKAVETTNERMRSLGEDIISNVNLDPVISPVLDMSNIQNGAKNIQDMFNNLNVNAAANAFNKWNKSMLPEVESGGSEVTTAPGGVVNNFTQNNYSPKALSAVEIYRRTNNQFTRLKGQPT